ncbi:ABC-type multidrug transport system, ATPase component [Polaribacter sp. Hel1_33_78]|jgi:ABC-type multidrug transport system ATPase subunit|uniref:ATP-binding cassette domain-containing protein n=1 Tax=unclassified Polaribacter TaxID=196858 RepID=UPI00052C4BF2|nr:MULTISPECIES: ATP-binding cassette domain-containing protein [unclassified Polaribacter]KGL60533.1 ABC transporter, ATP-binding protein [Polaribacter sp. Hel1_33_49]MBT3740764.1 ATP-binding cassette domain-containing protein [Polaribacter sp.]MBT4413920.1 ATP-binding cassette domain-containing protein [Polaribacter sp.]MBT7816722.1 ATP-binding cassette domain-containing protein [Polaribacter sp.]MDG1195429.1 ATP-binding cassette domain-containing protein [Polaribacter sp.]
MKLVIENLTKTYKNGVKAIDNLSIEIGTGMFGLLGPNGAGKSSLMRTIATLQSPDSGSITFGNINVLEDNMSLRKVLGYLPQSFGVYPKMSAEDLLDYFATLKGIANKSERKAIVKKVLEITNLYDVRRKHVAGYSGGMKQRFGIAQLLLNNPKLIIVDEPTAGLDPAERHRFLNVLREVGTNCTVIFSTHIVEDVKELCNEMAILNGGKILNHTTPQEATKEIDGTIWTKIINREDLEENEEKFDILSSNYNQDNTLNIRVHAAEKPSEEFIAVKPQLDDVYFIALKQDEPELV